jgi:hypothetical protein
VEGRVPVVAAPAKLSGPLDEIGNWPLTVLLGRSSRYRIPLTAAYKYCGDDLPPAATSLESTNPETLDVTIPGSEKGLMLGFPLLDRVI